MNKLRATAMDIALIFLLISVFVLTAACLLQINANMSADAAQQFDMSGLTTDWELENVSLTDDLGIAFIGVRASGHTRGFINSPGAVDALLDELAPQLRLLLSQSASRMSDPNGSLWRSLTDSSEHVYIKLHSELPHKLLPMLLDLVKPSQSGDSYMISELLLMSAGSETVLYARSAGGELISFGCNVSFDIERISSIEAMYHDSGFDYAYLSESGGNTVAVPFSSLPYADITVSRGASRDESANYELLARLGLTAQKRSHLDGSAVYTYITDKGTVNIGASLTYASSGVGLPVRQLAAYADSDSPYAYLTAAAVLIDTVKELGYIDDELMIYLSDVSTEDNVLTLEYIYCFDNIELGDSASARIVIKNNKITEFSFDIVEAVVRGDVKKSDNPRLLYYTAVAENANVIDLRAIYSYTADADCRLEWRAAVIAGGKANEV